MAEQHRTRALLVLLLTSTLPACNQLGAGEIVTPDAAAKTGPATRDYLISDESEDEHYGFYSYLLFAKRPVAANLDRFRAAMDAFWTLPPASLQRLAPSALNLTYTFVTESPDGTEADLSPNTLPDDPRRKPAIDWLITHHDYERSHDLLRVLAAAEHAGPYLVQSPTPLGARPGKQQQIFLHDLSSLSSATIADMVALLLKESDGTWYARPLEIWFTHVRDFWHQLGVNAEREGAIVSWIATSRLSK